MIDEEDDVITSLTVNPEDLKDQIFEAGEYQAEIAYCRAQKRRDDLEYNPGEVELRVGYRLESSDPEVDGKLVAPYGMLTTRGNNRTYKRWLKGMGYDVDGPEFTFDPGDAVGRKVIIKVSIAKTGKGADRRSVNRVDEVTAQA